MDDVLECYRNLFGPPFNSWTHTLKYGSSMWNSSLDNMENVFSGQVEKWTLKVTGVHIGSMLLVPSVYTCHKKNTLLVTGCTEMYLPIGTRFTDQQNSPWEIQK